MLLPTILQTYNVGIISYFLFPNIGRVFLSVPTIVSNLQLETKGMFKVTFFIGTVEF